jgi:prevent-host-death family protein
MQQINIHQAKTHLSALVEQAAAGEPFIIAKAGKPMVKVSAINEPEKPKRRIGFMKGKITIPDDFNRMCENEIINMFEGQYKENEESI